MALRKIKKIGWIGTGVMGNSMAGHLINNGHKLSVFNRTASKADSLLELGAEFKSPQEIAEESDALFLMLGYPEDLEKVIFEDSVLESLQPGSFLIDHTTSSPDLAKKIYSSCLEKGVHSLDAPVSGGDIGAKSGQLVVMTGGDTDVFNHVNITQLI